MKFDLKSIAVFSGFLIPFGWASYSLITYKLKQEFAEKYVSKEKLADTINPINEKLTEISKTLSQIQAFLLGKSNGGH